MFLGYGVFGADGVYMARVVGLEELDGHSGGVAALLRGIWSMGCTVNMVEMAGLEGYSLRNVTTKLKHHRAIYKISYWMVYNGNIPRSI